MIYCSSSLKGPFDGTWFEWLLSNVKSLKEAEHSILFGKEFFCISKGMQLMTQEQLKRYIEVAGDLMNHQLQNSESVVGNRIRDSFFTPSWIQSLSSHQSFSELHAKTYLKCFLRYFEKLASYINTENTDVLGICYSNYAFGTIGFQLSRETPDDVFFVTQKMFDAVYAVLLEIQEQRELAGQTDIPLSRMQAKRLAGMLEHIENAIGLCVGLYSLKGISNDAISTYFNEARERMLKDSHSPLVFEQALSFIDANLSKVDDLEYQDEVRRIANNWPAKKLPTPEKKGTTISRQQHLDEYHRVFKKYSGLELDVTFELNDLLHLEKLFLLDDLTDNEIKYVVGDWRRIPHHAVNEILNEFINSNSVSDGYKVSSLIELIESGFYEKDSKYSLGRLNILQPVFDDLVDNLKLKMASECKAGFIKALAMHMDRLPPTQQEKLEGWHQFYHAEYITAKSSNDNNLANSLDCFLSATSKRLISDHYYPALLNGNQVTAKSMAGALAFVIRAIDDVDLRIIRRVGVAEILSSSSFFAERLRQYPAIHEMYLAELLMEKADFIIKKSDLVIKTKSRGAM